MNNIDRKNLEKAEQLMREAIEIISQIAEAETEKFDNLSEGLQQTE